MITIPAGKFKAQCLAILDNVASSHEPIIVTKYGKPVVQVIPYSSSKGTSKNPLKNSILFEKNIIDPIDVQWEATE